MKYKLTEEKMTNKYGVELHRIQALCTFGNVFRGELGGWIEKEGNLSQVGECWVHYNAVVHGNAQVYGDAVVSGGALVSGNARVYDDAQLIGMANVYEHANIFGNAWVRGNAEVCAPL